MLNFSPYIAGVYGKVLGKLTSCLSVLCKLCRLDLFLCASMVSTMSKFFKHGLNWHHMLKCYASMDMNVHWQWARPSLCVFILKTKRS